MVMSLVVVLVPTIQGMADISEFVHNGGTHGAVTSDSEAEDEVGVCVCVRACVRVCACARARVWS